MRKVLSILLVILSVFTSIFAFSGCSKNNSSPTEPQNLALVLGNHQNFPKLSLTNQAIYSAIYAACYSYGKVTATVSDGTPYIAADYNISKPDAKVDNAKRKQIAKQNTEQIILECSTAYAKTPEIDTLTAISKAADSISSTSERKTLLVFDSGLSTNGLLNFASQNLFDASPELIVEQLKEMNAIPRVDGLNIIFTGLGQTCGSQKALSESHKAKLENIYTSILEEGGATVTVNREPLSNEESAADLPSCSVVPVVEDKLDIGSEAPEVVKFDDEKISFVADKAEFIDEKEAYEALTPVSELLNNDHNLNVLIVGSTASAGTAEGCRNLSLKRAKKVKEVLIDMGVSSSQLQTYGAGQDSTPLRVNDIINGQFVESEAKKNRAVYVINADSDLADYFI